MVTTNGTSHATTTVDGVVERVNERGLRLAGETEWRNLSRYAEPAPSIPDVGQPVRLTLDKSGYVRAIEPVGSTQADAPTRAEPGSAPADKDRRIVRMNALGHAVALVTAGGVSATTEAVLGVAAQLEAWVCR